MCINARLRCGGGYVENSEFCYHFLLALCVVIALYDCVNSKQTKTLKAIFKSPISRTIEWKAIECLLIAIGCEVVEGSGSRVCFVKDGMIEMFHRPHPAKEAKKYQVAAARAYLIRLGVKP